MSTAPVGGRAARTALITGAALGIGQQYAVRLAADGVRVIVADIADGSDTVHRIRSAGGEAIFVPLDVTSESSVAALPAATAEFGAVDILVHNAGIYPIQTFDAIDFPAWRRVMSVNLDALYLLTAAFLGPMRARGWGRIIGISSGMFGAGSPGAVHYVASKGGVVGFVRGLAPEVGGSGVTVNAIAPGLIRSHGTLTGPHTELGIFDAVLQAQDIKRTGVPEDVAGVLAFLVSDEASFMTGQTLTVDGGVARS